MPIRSGSADWQGNLKEGKGTVSVSKLFQDAAYSFPSRFEEGNGTNPEELIGAAHAACYSMAFANILATAGFTANSVSTTASVHLTFSDGKPSVSLIELSCNADVPKISNEQFQTLANDAKVGCPISRALASVKITLKASLK